VTVYVNDEWAADWAAASASPEKHELRIAAQLVQKQLLVLRFEISDPASLSRPGSRNDPGKPGLTLMSLRLGEAAGESHSGNQG